MEKLYKGVDEYIEEIIDGKKPNNNCLYHYTSFHGLEGIFESKSLFCTDVKFLNDTSEFVYVFKLAEKYLNSLRKCNELKEEEIQRLKMMPQSLDWPFEATKWFVFSFSNDPDSLSQWRAYGSGSGVSIGFDYENIIKQIKNSEMPKLRLYGNWLENLTGCKYSFND